MKRIAVFFADGFEEIEALAVVDVCRRAGIVVDMVSVTGKLQVKGAHEIVVQVDQLYSETDFTTYDMLVLPGGGQGTICLEAQEDLMEQIDAFYEAGKYIAAICAAPSIFGHRGILKGRKACSYPSFESHLEGAIVTKGPVEISNHVITSRGMGTAMDFGLAITGVLLGEEISKDVAQKIVYNRE